MPSRFSSFLTLPHTCREISNSSTLMDDGKWISTESISTSLSLTKFMLFSYFLLLLPLLKKVCLELKQNILLKKPGKSSCATLEKPKTKNSKNCWKERKKRKKCHLLQMLHIHCLLAIVDRCSTLLFKLLVIFSTPKEYSFNSFQLFEFQSVSSFSLKNILSLYFFSHFWLEFTSSCGFSFLSFFRGGLK